MENNQTPGTYCDHSHPGIKAVAAGIKRDDDDAVAVAARTFYYVRDTIVFGFDRYQRKASETLQRGFGACWNKSLLLVALLRCNRIQACLGSVPVKRGFIRPAIGIWHWLANHPYNHCLVHAFLNQRWIILDPVLDRGTYETFYRPAGVGWGIDWNGRDDVRLYTESVIGPTVFHRQIDETIDRKAGNVELSGWPAAFVSGYMNRRMWKMTGCTPPN